MKVFLKFNKHNLSSTMVLNWRVLKNLVAVGLAFQISACAYLSSFWGSENDRLELRSSPEFFIEENKKQNWKQALESGQSEVIELNLQEMKNFVAENELSRHRLEIELLIAKSLNQLQRPREALLVIKTLLENRDWAEDSFLGQVYIEGAQSAQALNQTEKAIIYLRSASAFGSELPRGDSMVLLNARLASLYAELGQTEIATSYLAAAEQGLTQLKLENKNETTPKWMAKLYYRIAPTPAEFNNENEFSKSFRGFLKTQKYLWLSYELQQEPDSQIAAHTILRQYQKAWQFILNYESKDIEQTPWARIAEAHQVQQKLCLDWIESFNDLDSFASLSTLNLAAQKNTKNHAIDLMPELIKIKKQVEEHLVAISDRNPITEESLGWAIKGQKNVQKVRRRKLNNPITTNELKPLTEPNQKPLEMPDDPNLR